jgi:hypothetical protein
MLQFYIKIVYLGQAELILMLKLSYKIHLLDEPGYVIPCVGKHTAEKSHVSMSEYLTGI